MAKVQKRASYLSSLKAKADALKRLDRIAFLKHELKMLKEEKRVLRKKISSEAKTLATLEKEESRWEPDETTIVEDTGVVMAYIGSLIENYDDEEWGFRESDKMLEESKSTSKQQFFDVMEVDFDVPESVRENAKDRNFLLDRAYTSLPNDFCVSRCTLAHRLAHSGAKSLKLALSGTPSRKRSRTKRMQFSPCIRHQRTS